MKYASTPVLLVAGIAFGFLPWTPLKHPSVAAAPLGVISVATTQQSRAAVTTNIPYSDA